MQKRVNEQVVSWWRYMAEATPLNCDLRLAPATGCTVRQTYKADLRKKERKKMRISASSDRQTKGQQVIKKCP